MVPRVTTWKVTLASIHEHFSGRPVNVAHDLADTTTFCILPRSPLPRGRCRLSLLRGLAFVKVAAPAKGATISRARSPLATTVAAITILLVDRQTWKVLRWGVQSCCCCCRLYLSSSHRNRRRSSSCCCCCSRKKKKKKPKPGAEEER